MLKLYPHQQQASDKGKEILAKHNIVYLAMEMRCGKTLTAIDIARSFNNILVVTKKKAIPSWESDLKLAECDNFTLINYESLHKIDDTFDLLICDEVHSISSYPKPSARTKILKEKYSHLPMIFLSGTPSAETYSQLFHQFWISNSTPFEHKNFYAFYREWGDDDSIFLNGRQLKQYKKTRKTVLKQIEHLMITMTQQDAGFDVKINEKFHYVKCSNEYLNLMKELKRHKVINIKHLGESYEVICETPASLLQKNAQIASGTLKIDENLSVNLSHHKIDYIKNNTKYDKKVVVMCNYVQERSFILENLPRSTEDLDEFKNGKACFFVGNIKRWSEGINFSYADSMIIYSLNFSSTTYLQVRERLSDKKRKEPITIHYLFTEGSIDKYIYDAVKNKQNFTASYYKKASKNML